MGLLWLYAELLLLWKFLSIFEQQYLILVALVVFLAVTLLRSPNGTTDSDRN